MKMLIILFILEIISVARSGRDELTLTNTYADKFDNLASESLNAQESLSSLQFQPQILDFIQRSIGDPYNQVVTLFNKHKHKNVYLGSITGSSSDFYSSYFEDKVIPPLSNTTFKVVFLPRQLGETNSSLIIHTSFGVVNYQVHGVGVECQYKLRPLIGIKLPLYASISPEIQLYNPHDFALQISEIYSSGGEFQLELPSVSSGGQEGDYKLWEIPPYTSKPIIRVLFKGERAGNHTAYVRIKIAGTLTMEEKMLVVPIEIEIYNDTGIYSQVPLLDFGMVGLYDGVRRYVYNLLNSGPTSVSIKNWGVENDYHNIQYSHCVIVDVVQFSRHNFTDHFTVEVDWSKCSNMPNVVRGNILLTADISSDDDFEEITYRVPFFGHVIEGNLSYKANDLMFLRGDKKSYETSRSIILKNNYNVPLAITNLTVPESCLRYFKLTGFKPLILQPGSFAQLLEIRPLIAVQKIATNETTITESFRIVTNVTYYDIPVTSYTGLLRRIVPVDFAREQSQVDEKALNFGALLPVSKQSELLIAFVNENPIPIDITSWKGAITSGNGQAQISSIQRGCSKMSLDNLVFCNPSIKPGEWVVFAVSVQSSVVGSFGGHFVVKSPFEEINTPVKFSTAMGRLELKSKMIFDDCFPGKICSLSVQAYSTFMKKMYVEGIAVDMDGISYEFAVKGPNELPEILPNIDTEVGKLFFNPKDVLCKKPSTCYTSFDALSRPVGEAWMRTLTNHTAYTQWDNDRLRTQISSFMEVKQSLKQMQFRLTTSQIRRYEFNASINFVWPRLMNANVEFPFVQINKLETHFIDVYNPSNQLLFIHFVLHNFSQHGDKVNLLPEAIRDCPHCAIGEENPFTFNTSVNKGVFMDEVKPLSSLRVGINFIAKTPGTYSTVLYMRNNLTVVEAVWLSARAVVPQFKFGNRKPGNTTPLQFEITEKHTKLCDKKAMSDVMPNVLISSKRTFTAKNYGEVPLMISGMRIENDLCLGYGFKVLNCDPFQLMPNESKKIEIAFSPDFTLSRVVRTLNFDTSIGSYVNFTLIGTIASPALETCSKNIKRPIWESDFKRNTLVVLCVALFLVLLASTIDSDRILKDHMRMIVRDHVTLQPPLDLRLIGREASSSVETTQSFVSSNQERLNNLNNHQTSLNNIKKRLNMTRKNDVTSSDTPNGRFVLNKTGTESRNKLASSPKGSSNSTSPNNEVQQRPARQEINKERLQQEVKENKKKIVFSEDDSVSSSSSKENCVGHNHLKAEQQNNLPVVKNKSISKKSKNQLNTSEQPKDQKIIVQKPMVKPLNTNENHNKNPQPIKEVKINKLQAPEKATSPSSSEKLKSDDKSQALTPYASFCLQESQHPNYHVNDVITNTIESEANLLTKNEIHREQSQTKKTGKTPGRERKIPMNTNAAQYNNIHNISNNIVKRATLKDNKQFQVRQNLSSSFGNLPKFTNGHQNAFLPNNNNNININNNSNWVQQSVPSNIWSSPPITSYSDVTKAPIEPSKINHNFGMMNGNVNFGGLGPDHDLIRMSSFNRSYDRYVLPEQEETSQYGPIGTRKSPSSTPSWEPLTAGINTQMHLAKPSAFNSDLSFFSPSSNYGNGMQQSKLMKLMSCSEKSAQVKQQQMEEQYRYLTKLKEARQAAEWNATAPSSNNLWSPSYCHNETPSSPISSNWSTSSPLLAVPPGFEQQYQQSNNHQNGDHMG